MVLEEEKQRKVVFLVQYVDVIDEEDEVDEKDDLGVIIMNIGFDKFLF